MVEVRVLGPLQVVEGDREIPLGSARERALLAALVVGPRDGVRGGALLDALWGTDPPRSATKQLQNQVLRVRKALGATAIRTTPTGYALGDQVGVDAIRFEAELRAAREDVARGNVRESLPRFAAALALWRDRPFEELVDWSPATTEAARLEELRRTAEEEQLDARLDGGGAADCVADAEALVAAEPLREHRWSQLMLSLYRGGQQAAALRAYQRARETLARELGIEPGPELQAQERAVLAHDPRLLLAPTHTDEARLPSGVVTFLLTDIEDSTRRWEEHPEAMARAIVLHDDTIAGVVHGAGGTLLKSKGEGDSTLSVFTRTTDAVAAALAMRDQLDQVPWPPGAALAVRCALHTGEALEREGDYFGPTLNRAARIRALAVGGQILMSQASTELIRDHLPAGSDLVELGALELRDLERPEQVYALVEHGIPGRDVAGRVRPDEGVPALEPADHERFFGRDDRRALVGPPRRSTRRWPLIVGAIAVVVALVVAAAALFTGGGPTATRVQGVVAPTAYVPRYEAEACPPDVLSDPSIHVPGLVCGSLLVPQDRSNPHGRMIRVGVLRAPARTQGNNLPPVIDVGAHDSLALSPARDRAELIQINDRGFASLGAPKLTCPEVTAVLSAGLARSSDDPATLAESTDAVARCRTRLLAEGVNPAGYTPEAEVRDVLDLMVALKISLADLESADVDTAVAFGVLEHAPGAVRTITLENPFPPGAGLLTDPVGDLAGALNAYLGQCAADAACSSAYPNLRTALLGVHDHYTANPVLVAASDSTDPNAPPIPLLLNGPRSIDALTSAFTSSAAFPLIPAAVSPTPVDSVIAAAVRTGNPLFVIPEWPLGAILSFTCSYDVHLVNVAASTLSARTYPQLVGTQPPWAQWCAQWKVPDVSGALSTEVASPVPILMTRGAIAPHGSAQWIHQLPASFPHATVVVFPTLGEDLLGNGPSCLAGIRRRFLADPHAKLDVASCVRQSPPIKFVAPP